MMKLRYTRRSINDLSRLRQFIAQHNPAAAKRIADQIVSSVEKLKDFPYLGVKVPASQSDAIRDLFVRDYTIRYLVQQNEIVILRLWHDKEEERARSD
jgi:addiction module RelE/StbE family toxin